ncbi:hypothetical protein Hanom_Chr04g00320291 [Helianthus anomalus]
MLAVNRQPPPHNSLFHALPHDLSLPPRFFSDEDTGTPGVSRKSPENLQLAEATSRRRSNQDAVG